MPIKFACPKCKTVLQVSSKMAGKKGKCQCGYEFTIPNPAKAKTKAGAKDAQQTKSAAAANMVSAAMFDELTESDFARTSPFDKQSGGGGTNKDLETLERFTQEEMVEKKKAAGNIKGILKFVSFLILAGGIGSLALTGVVAASPSTAENLQGFLPMARLSSALAATFFSLVGVIAIVGGIGTFLMTAWGWLASVAVGFFLIAERIGAVVIVAMEGFSQTAFFGAMVPLLGGVFLTTFLCKDEPKTLCGVSSKVSVIIGAIVGLALGGGAIGAVFGTASDTIQKAQLSPNSAVVARLDPQLDHPASQL